MPMGLLFITMLFTVTALVGCAHPTAPACVAERRAFRHKDALALELLAVKARYVAAHPATISQGEAIERAAQFVRDQGFTEDPPRDDLPFWRDFVESESISREEVLAYRHDSIAPHPIGAHRDPKFWLVAFPFSERYRKTRTPRHSQGMIVRINIMTGHASMQHQATSCLAEYEEPWTNEP